ncbi:MAG: outer membrane lipoprotein carrier protein LolA [Succinivibrio sp.]
MIRTILSLILTLVLLASRCTCALDIQSIQSIYDRKDFSASYTQEKTLSRQNIVLKSSGTIIVINQKNVLIRQDLPFEQEMIITPDALIQLLDDEKLEITRQKNPAVFEISNMILRIFTTSQDIEKYFQCSISGSKKSWTVTLVPKDEILKKVFRTISIEGEGFLKKISITDTSGDSTVMNYTEHTHILPELKQVEREYIEP